MTFSAEAGVSDHVMTAMARWLETAMIEHYSHIRLASPPFACWVDSPSSKRSDLQVLKNSERPALLNALSLKPSTYPLCEYGNDTGIKSSTDLIDDGVQVTANHKNAIQHVRLRGSADCNSNSQG